MAEQPDLECGLAVIHPWLCDAMGHLTTRNYLAIFDDAAYQLFAMLGHDAKAATAASLGWADVRHEIEYLGELQTGAVVRVTGRVVAVGLKSVTCDYQLLDRSGDRLCATLKAKTACFDLQARRARPLPSAFLLAVDTRFGVSREAPSSPQ
jgi:acyl-CoA thioester hydrolase